MLIGRRSPAWIWSFLILWFLNKLICRDWNSCFGTQPVWCHLKVHWWKHWMAGTGTYLISSLLKLSVPWVPWASRIAFQRSPRPMGDHSVSSVGPKSDTIRSMAAGTSKLGDENSWFQYWWMIEVTSWGKEPLVSPKTTSAWAFCSSRLLIHLEIPFREGSLILDFHAWMRVRFCCSSILDCCCCNW